MKKIVLLLLLIYPFFSINAQQLFRSEVVAVAKNTLKRMGKNVNTINVDSIYVMQQNGRIIIQEVVFSSGESVLLSGHKSCRPVIGYTLPEPGRSSCILKNYYRLPDQIKDFLSYFGAQVEMCFNTDRVLPINQEWYTLQDDSQTRTSDIIIVSPLLSSRWGQDTSNCGLDPQAYNYYVSQSSDNCSHCPAGCGPVAMAQIMYFWKFPVLTSLMGDYFDWCNMTDFLDTRSPNYEKERNAIARLIRQCGLAANAWYCFSGCSTGTYSDDVAEALHSLGYEGEYVIRDECSNCDWKEMLKTDLDSSLPILYAGRGIGSHFFVCDGYSSEGYFHFNWGWNGQYNSLWLTIDNICPGSFNFSTLQTAIFNIRPSTNVDFCDFSMPLNEYYDLVIRLYGNDYSLYSVTPKMMTTLMSAPSSSPTSYRTIPAGATAEYVAHKEVILQPGFTAEYGSDFTARIEPCAACEERMIQVDVLTENDDWQGIDTSQMEMRMYKKGDTAILFQPSVLTLFPNPTSNTLTVQAPNPTEDIHIFDIAGHRVYRWYIESRTEKSTVLNIADIPTGNYILRVQTKDGKSHIGRFAKK